MRLSLFIAVCTALLQLSNSKPSFIIDYDNNQFLKDGQPFRYISGSIHYFRIPNYYWEDRLAKIRAAGLNAIEFYIPWNFHEPYPGQYEWNGDKNLTRFLDIAKKHDLAVILRVGPYTCGEWENGGLPWWLLKHANIQMRTSDANFLAETQKWWNVLLPIVKANLYENGGSIVMVQLENEYGSFRVHDRDYMIWLRDEARKQLGETVVLFTTDGGDEGYLVGGYTPGLYPTVDFGPGSKEGIEHSFAAQRKYAPKGPLVNSEFYPGWLDLWGESWSVADIKPILDSMDIMYNMNASFNFYMFEGGTNFGYMSSGAWGSPFKTVTTSYDYNSPLSEAGDPTSKYYQIRDKITSLTHTNPLPVPGPTTKTRYGSVPMKFAGTILDVINIVTTQQIDSQYPLSMEDIDFPYGFLLYQIKLNISGSKLSISGINDRCYVMTTDTYFGTLVRDKQQELSGTFNKNINLYLLVENMGRTCDGRNNPKGIVSNVTLDGKALENWKISTIDLARITKFAKKLRNKTKFQKSSPTFLPSFYYGSFSTQQVTDTFFDPTNWGKGQLFINNYNVGRYWPSLGPQITLYVPKTMLSIVNTIVMFELEQPGNCNSQRNIECAIEFTDVPFLNKTVGSVETQIHSFQYKKIKQH